MITKITVSILGVLVLLVLVVPSIHGQSATMVTPPSNSTMQGLVSQIGYVHGGTIGTAISLDPQDNVLLFTFSTQTGAVLDQSDLTPILGPEVVRGNPLMSSSRSFLRQSGITSLVDSRRSFKPVAQSGLSDAISFFDNVLANVQTFDSLGLIVVSGEDAIGVPSRTQHVIMFSSDTGGQLSKLWDKSYPSLGGAPGPTYPAVAFNSDGSGLYVLTFLAALNAPSVTSTVSVLRIADGSTAGSLVLPNSNSLAIGLADDPANQRVVVFVSPFLYTIPEQSDNVAVGETVKISEPGFPDDLPSSLLGIAGGQFALVYGWTGLPAADITSGDSIFFSTDLNSGKTTHSLVGDGGALPFANNIIYDPAGSHVLVPYSFTALAFSNLLELFSGGQRVSVAPVSSTGRLMKAAQVKIPLNSTASDSIQNGCNSVASATGAMVFIATNDGTLFTVDAQTGAVINSALIDTNGLVWISLDAATNQLLFNDGMNLGILSSPDQPTISAATVTDHILRIEGGNFLSGASVTVNGKSVSASAGPRPGRQLVVEDASGAFAAGQGLSVVVTNPDKRSSSVFTIRGNN